MYGVVFLQFSPCKAAIIYPNCSGQPSHQIAWLRGARVVLPGLEQPLQGQPLQQLRHPQTQISYLDHDKQPGKVQSVPYENMSKLAPLAPSLVNEENCGK